VPYNECDTHLKVMRYGTDLFATDTFIHEWNEPFWLYSPAAEQVHHHTLADTSTYFPSS